MSIPRLESAAFLLGKHLVNGLLLVCSIFSKAQGLSFEVQISNDTVLLGNYVEIEFTIKNGDGKFVPPEFHGLRIIAGPNRASTYSIVNGVVNQSASYTYFLEADEPGHYVIKPALLIVGNKEYSTPEISFVVVENPDGIRQYPKARIEKSEFDFPREKPKRKITKL